VLEKKVLRVIFGCVINNPEFNKLAEAVTPLTCIREMPSLDLEQNTFLTDDYRAFLQSPQARRNNTLN
jgi:hypothetical protein